MIKITKKLSNGVLPSILTVIGLMAAVASAPAAAAKFGVKVVDQSGQAIEGVAVCAGLPGNYRQFGSMFTDASGLAILNVPEVPLLITLSKSRMGSMEIKEPARGFNLIKQITLTQDMSRTKCDVEGAQTSKSSIQISNVQVSDDPFAVTLRPTVTGNPTEYRVSRTDSFADVQWQRFQTSIPLSSNLSAQAEVYIQMRRYSGSKKSWIEARSEVVNVKLISFE